MAFLFDFFTYLGCRASISANEVVFLCKVFDINSFEYFCCALSNESKFPFEAILQIQTNLLRKMPEQLVNSIPLPIRLRRIHNAVADNDLLIVELLWTEDVERSQIHQLALKSIKADDIELLEFFMQQKNYVCSSLQKLTAKENAYSGEMNLFTYACIHKSIKVMQYLMDNYNVDPADCHQIITHTGNGRIRAVPPTTNTVNSPMKLLLENPCHNVMAQLLLNYDDEDKLLLSEELHLPPIIDTPQTCITLLEKFCKVDKLSVVKLLVPETSPIAGDFLETCINYIWWSMQSLP